MGLWVAVVVILVVGACGADDEKPAGGVPLAGAGEVYVPGPIEGHAIGAVSRIRIGDPVYGELHGTGPLVVTEVDGAIVGVVAAQASAIEAGWSGVPGALGPDDRVPSVGDRPTVAVLGELLAAPRPGTSIGWRATDDTMVSVASRDLDLAGLVGVAERVTVGAGGELTVPGTEIGRIPRSWTAPQPSIRVRYGGDEVVVHTARPDVQAAYAALLHEDPSSFLEQVADPACCQPEILRERRTVEIGERTGTLGTLTPTIRVLVVDGDPGAVLLAEVGVGVADDTTLVAIAESLTAVAEADVDERLAELTPSTTADG